ncbi:MAG: flagellar brake protein [Desulfocucumaceae bacterium]
MALKLFGFTFKQSQKVIVKRTEDDTKEFIASLENVMPQGVTISTPMHHLKPMPLLRGETIYVKIALESFTISFTTRVKAFRQDNIPLVLLDYPEDYQRVQRRNAVRMRTLLDVEVSALPVSDPVSPDKKPNQEARQEPGPEQEAMLLPAQEPVCEKGEGVDISAGGMEIILKVPFERDSLVMVKFILEIDTNKFHKFNIKSRIRRVQPVPPNRIKLGVEFLNLGMSESDKIFQYIFKKSTRRK